MTPTRKLRLVQQPLSLRIAMDSQASDRQRHHGTVLLLREKIQSALNEGQSRCQIWRTLSAEGRVSMKYPTFLRCLRRADIRGPRREDSAPADRRVELGDEQQYPSVPSSDRTDHAP